MSKADKGKGTQDNGKLNAQERVEHMHRTRAYIGWVL